MGAASGNGPSLVDDNECSGNLYRINALCDGSTSYHYLAPSEYTKPMPDQSVPTMIDWS